MTSSSESSFENLSLIEPVLRAVRSEGYKYPTPIQEKAIPYILKGRDLLGCAQTGTGKTAAFALPILQRLFKNRRSSSAKRVIRALVLSPTRELAAQIGESFKVYGKHTGLRSCVIFGGVRQHQQVSALRQGVDIVIATPGRLLDLMGQRLLKFGELDILVLDEADRMLDMGFMPDVSRIVSAIPADRQTLFFSATLTPDIQHLAMGIVQEPVRVDVEPSATPVDNVKQVVYYVEKYEKRDLLVHLLKEQSVSRALVFTRTKHSADRLARYLTNAGLRVLAIHGNKSQSTRQKALGSFRNGNVRVLVATDIAARGLDVDGISHVFNLDLPNEPEVYVHRIGRTARAGAEGIALTFCGREERPMLSQIQKLIRGKIEVEREHPFVSWVPEPKEEDSRKKVKPARLRRPLKRFRRRR